jgi:glycosyltransferase involved in cell wall biosynthesis
MRLAVFVDQVFWRDGKALSTNESYIRFVASFADLADKITFIGREAAEPGRAPYVLDHPAITLLGMPYFSSLYQIWRANPRIYGQIRNMIRAHARSWDAILISGPHPIGQMIARQCAALGVPVALIVRQNLVAWMRTHQGLKRHAAVTAAQVLEWDFKRLARGRTVFAVGTEMAEQYRPFSGRVHSHFACLVDEAQLRLFSAMPATASPARLICVGRLGPEKGHQFLIEALGELKARGLECHLDVVGDGPLKDELKARTAALGLGGQVTFHGYVPYGPSLFNLYQQAGMLVLPSLTEGFPQVINESLCAGLPTIATAVGGIPAFLSDGDTALLVPPGDSSALAAAIERAIGDQELRERLRRNGRALMADHTLEANRARLMDILRNEVLACNA